MKNKFNYTAYEISLSLGQERVGTTEIVKNMLIENDIPLEKIVESKIRNRSKLSIYTDSKTQGNKYFKILKNLPLRHIRPKINTLKRRDWQDKWKKGLKPFPLTHKFIIIPGWHKGYVKNNRKLPILLDTTLAFGTGLHETTRFVSELIVEKEGQFKSFLDIGTGTGILSIIARKCSAEHVDGVEMDKQAAKVAKRNLDSNGTQFNRLFSKSFSQWSYRKKYDMVVANLTTIDLLKLGKKIQNCVKDGRYLILSGVSIKKCHQIRKMMKTASFTCKRIIKGKTWTAFLYQKDKE